MNIILIGGLWLDVAAWDPVIESLHTLDHDAIAVSLPGQGAPPTGATLDDQRAAVLRAVDAAAAPAMVVGHSAASTLAWIAADARPTAVTRTVLIGGFPSADGERYADFFPVVDGAMAFPGWEAFEGPDIDDLTEAQRDTFRAAAVPVPEGVARGVVALRDPRRHEVPVTVVCPEFSVADARGWVRDGEVPELAAAHDVDYVDIASGHWPMISCPERLAEVLAGLTG